MLKRYGGGHEAQRTQSAEGFHRRAEEGGDDSACTVEIAGGNIVKSSITNEAVDDLGLEQGQKVIVVIKASDVMIAAE